jgi:hypothetical protein
MAASPDVSLNTVLANTLSEYWSLRERDKISHLRKTDQLIFLSCNFTLLKEGREKFCQPRS